MEEALTLLDQSRNMVIILLSIHSDKVPVITKPAIILTLKELESKISQTYVLIAAHKSKHE